MIESLGARLGVESSKQQLRIKCTEGFLPFAVLPQVENPPPFAPQKTAGGQQSIPLGWGF
jgi:hypothetical protein